MIISKFVLKLASIDWFIETDYIGLLRLWTQNVNDDIEDDHNEVVDDSYIYNDVNIDAFLRW